MLVYHYTVQYLSALSIFSPLAFRTFFVSHPSILGLIKSIRNPGVSLFPIFSISKNLILHFFFFFNNNHFLFRYFFFFFFYDTRFIEIFRRARISRGVSMESISITLYNHVLLRCIKIFDEFDTKCALTRISPSCTRLSVTNAFSDSRWSRYTRHCILYNLPPS